LIFMSKRSSKIFKAVKTKGRASRLLEARILQTSRNFPKLTVRQVFYLLVSRFRYSARRRTYKRLSYHLCKLRRKFPELNAKFHDPTRPFVKAPLPFSTIELWVEKDAIRSFLEDLARRHRIGIQVLRGFASLSMYRRALLRAAKRGVTKILYVGDFDPSGLLIESVAAREMGIQVERIALTMKQIERHKPLSLPVNRRDSRAKDYVKKYGRRCWEVEALRPRIFLKLVEKKLREYVPQEYLARANTKERAATIARPIVQRLVRGIRSEALRLMETGLEEGDIVKQLASKYDLNLEEPEPLEVENNAE